MSKVITVFEHNRLEVGVEYPVLRDIQRANKGQITKSEIEHVEFKPEHFNALVKYNEQNESRFFTVGFNKIKFNQYVGVIAVHGLTVEVLPKADGNDDETKWQQALIDMLKVAHGLPLHESGHAQLALRRTSVLEYFLRLFVEEVQKQVHQGLVKRYRQKAGVSTALKGRLDLPNHIRHSIVHKERFHVIHQVYDTDHVLHSILKKALVVVENVTHDPLTMGLAQDMQWAFEHVQDRPITPQTFERIALNRKTKSYENALQLAKLLLLNYAPDVRSGREQILSLLFDMNKLFEVVVLRLLQRASQGKDITVSGRNRQDFWNGQPIKPDLVLSRGAAPPILIADTKWKVPKGGNAESSDLKQMYVYNAQWNCTRSLLLYPSQTAAATGHHIPAAEPFNKQPHGCSMGYVQLFDPIKGGLRKDAGTTLLTALLA